MANVALRDFAVDFPGFTVGPLSFTLAPGDRVALVGANGAGKSTTLRALVGLVPGARGTAVVDGMDVAQAGAQVRGAVGLLCERLLGFGWMTVSEHLAFLASFYPRWDAAYASELCRRLAIPQRTKLANLSRGTGVKLSLVAAEAFRPPLLLLDEPTSGLDPVVRTDVLDLIDACAPRGGARTVVFSTHILEDIESVADRVLVLREGRLVEDTPVEEVRARRPGVPLTRILREVLSHA